MGEQLELRKFSGPIFRSTYFKCVDDAMMPVRPMSARLVPTEAYQLATTGQTAGHVQLQQNVHRSQNRIEAYHQLRSALAQVCCVIAITRTPRWHQSASTLTPSLRLRARRSSLHTTTVSILPAKMAPAISGRHRAVRWSRSRDPRTTAPFCCGDASTRPPARRVGCRSSDPWGTIRGYRRLCPCKLEYTLFCMMSKANESPV
jgi:hypothetical protein